MTRTYQRTVKAESIDGWNVAVTFADGTCGTFDFSPFANYPCYSPLKKLGVFACARTDHGTLAFDIAGNRDEYHCVDIDFPPLSGRPYRFRRADAYDEELA